MSVVDLASGIAELLTVQQDTKMQFGTQIRRLRFTRICFVLSNRYAIHRLQLAIERLTGSPRASHHWAVAHLELAKRTTECDDGKVINNCIDFIVLALANRMLAHIHLAYCPTYISISKQLYDKAFLIWVV